MKSREIQFGEVFVLVVVLLFGLALVGCESKSEPTAVLSDKATSLNPRLAGEWETDIILSQLGQSVTRYRFKKDGTFEISTSLIQMGQELSGHGTYRTKGNQLTLTSPMKTTEATYSFDGNTLIIKESSGDVFRLNPKETEE